MSPEAQLKIAQDFLTLSALHHLAIVVIMVVFWIRRKSMERTVAIYMSLAFATSAFAMAGHEATRAWGVMSALLAVLWIVEAVRVANTLAFRSTPKFRLTVMALVCAFGLSYPGYSEGLPTFVFSPLGVTLPPTLIVALAALNSAAPTTGRLLHWSLAAAGIAVSCSGIFREGWIHVPLLVASVYAIPLLLGRGKIAEARSEADATSLSAMHDRIHKRRVLLSRPRRSSIRKLDIRGRKR